MILILNCMVDPKLADSFDRALMRPLSQVQSPARFVRLSAGEPVPELLELSHVIISGSESSVLDDRPWDRDLENVVHAATRAGIRLLGICYGHQFLGRVLAGRAHVRRSPTPELGWARIQVSAPENPLFGGERELVSMVSHYDEVFGIEPESGLKILARSDRCAVHAFQYRDQPVWGVQFHPEYDVPEAEEIFGEVMTADPQAFIDRDLRRHFDPDVTTRLLVRFLRQ